MTPIPPGLPKSSTWVPQYRPDELPALLAGTRIGIFPSYLDLEGYGLAVVEQLAAGIPVVAYDVPGPRDILRPIDPSLLVRPGDVSALAKRGSALLSSDPAVYTALSTRCIDRARQLTWKEWIRPMLDYYRGDRQGDRAFDPNPR